VKKARIKLAFLKRIELLTSRQMLQAIVGFSDHSIAEVISDDVRSILVALYVGTFQPSPFASTYFQLMFFIFICNELGLFVKTYAR